MKSHKHQFSAGTSCRSGLLRCMSCRPWAKLVEEGDRLPPVSDTLRVPTQRLEEQLQCQKYVRKSLSDFFFSSPSPPSSFPFSLFRLDGIKTLKKKRNPFFLVLFSHYIYQDDGLNFNGAAADWSLLVNERADSPWQLNHFWGTMERLNMPGMLEADGYFFYELLCPWSFPCLTQLDIHKPASSSTLVIKFHITSPFLLSHEDFNMWRQLPLRPSPFQWESVCFLSLSAAF